MTTNNILTEPRFIETAFLIKAKINDTSKIIEIGANDASFKSFLSQEKNKNWTTVDKFGNPDIKSDLDGQSAKLPFPDNSIDILICTEVLEHLILGTYLIKEISRVLKKDGVAIISVPNIVSLKSRVKVLFGRLPGNAASGDCGQKLGGTGYLIDGDWVGGHVVDFNFKRLIKYLERGGLKLKKHHKLSLAINYKRQLFLKVPSIITPKSLSDYILVEVSPK